MSNNLMNTHTHTLLLYMVEDQLVDRCHQSPAVDAAVATVGGVIAIGAAIINGEVASPLDQGEVPQAFQPTSGSYRRDP
jgi:hypothetical protein